MASLEAEPSQRDSEVSPGGKESSVGGSTVWSDSETDGNDPVEGFEVNPATLVQANPAALQALSNREFLNSVSDLFAITLPADLSKDWAPTTQFSGFDSIAWTNFDAKFVEDRLLAAEKIADLAMLSKKVMVCTATDLAHVQYAACAKSILEPLFERGFRRPLTAEELLPIQTSYESGTALARANGVTAPGDQLKEGLRAAIGHLLFAPQFLIKGERPKDPTFTGERALDAFELASRIAFVFTNSLPDDTLWALAKSGELTQQEVLEREVDRLLTTRTDRFVESFMGQWLGVRDLSQAAAGTLSSSMWQETKAVLLEIVREGLPVNRMMNPGFTYLNQQLATHYGIAGAFDSTFKRQVTADRGGVLTLGSVLTATSTPTLTSPIRRGRYVQGRVLCKTVPLPSPELFEQIAASAAAIPATATVKERMNRHQNTSDICYSCHKYMDPIGLGMESFSEKGQTRSVYADGRPVETDSNLLGTPFQTFNELNQLLWVMPDVYRCASEKLAIYSLGRVLDTKVEADRALVATLSRTTDGRIPSVRELVHRMIRSVAFRNVAHVGGAP